MKFFFLFILSVLLGSILTSCVSYQKLHPDSIVVVKEIDIPNTSSKIAQFATHSYIDYRVDVNSPWYRVEVTHPKSGVRTTQLKDNVVNETMRWGERVRVLSQTNGVRNPNLIRDIRHFARTYNDSVYRSYPGPNSNTFIEKMLRRVNGISAILDHNAIGKESGFYFGQTSGGSGLKAQTPVAGLAVGLKEGVEVSFIGLSIGVSVWPPSIRIPFLPRIPTWE